MSELESISTFDALRESDGRWSARKIQKHLGYLKWQRFENAIMRGRRAIEVDGGDPDREITGVGQDPLPGKPGSASRDYIMTREGVYATIQGADLNKVEIATAWKYFRVRTQEAENNIAIVDKWSEHPLVMQADLLREMSVKFAENDVRWIYQERVNNEQGQVLHEVEMRMGSYESHIGWITGRQYCKQKGLPTDEKFILKLGIRAGKIGRRDGHKAGSAADDRYGSVNKWPEYVWEEAARELGY